MRLSEQEQRKLVEELTYLTKDVQISNRADEMARLVPKWEKTGLLEGYNPIQKIQLAGLLENEAIVVKRTLFEATDTTDIAGFNKIAFPLVKKVFDKLIAQDLVSLQTMDRPAGLVFYEDYQFETSQPGFTATSSLYQDLDTSVSGRLGGRGAGLTTGGFYEGKHWYSNRWMSQSLSVSAVDSDTVLIPWTSITGIGAGADESKPLYINSVQLEFAGWTGNNAYFNIPSSDTVSTSATVLGATSSPQTVTVNYVPDTDIDNRGDFESVSAIPSINMKIASVPVTTNSRKLKAGWTQEGAQDVMAFHGIDAEVELTSTLSDMVSLEINNNILSDLTLAAQLGGNTVHWSYRIGKYVDDSGTTVTGMSYTTGHIAFHGTQREWNETLVNKFVKVGNRIYKKTLRGEANRAIVSPDVATALEATLNWRTLEGGPQKYSSGIEKVGTVNGRIEIIKHATYKSNLALLIHKGDGWLETGYVYAPYIMLYMTPVVYDPDTFEPRKMILTRDARQVIKPEFFGLVKIDDLDVE